MKRIRKFNSVQEMQAFSEADYFSFLGMVKINDQPPIMHIHKHMSNLPSNLVVSCDNNTVTITATNALSIQYRLNPNAEYITYTAPFAITETVTVYAKASNADGNISIAQVCEYVDPIDYTIPFYIEDISGESNTVSIKKSNNSAPTLTIQKSTDGETWESIGSTSTTGITATVPANGKLYLRCSANSWGNTYYNTINTTRNCNFGGNIMSLLYGSSFTGNETTFPSGSTGNFKGLFRNSDKLISASELLLPATILTTYCYQDMFSNCTSLTTAPELPATTLVNECYKYMFYNCTSLTTAPELPATTLTSECYSCMFYGCTSLTAAPELPATTLAYWCYFNMFYGCTSLTAAPELPATTLADGCYLQMFYGCTNINYIKCLATDISASSCTSNWASGVAATGTFVKDANMTSWTTGTSGIPTGWVVRDAGNISLEQNLNVATIKISDLDEGSGYYTINGGSHISVGNGTTTIPITQAMNGQVLLVHGEFSGEPSEETLTLSWTDYSPSVTITESNNYVTITSATADTIQYRLGSSGSFTPYTEPVYINTNTTIYVQATKTVSGVDYTTNTSQEVTHEPILPTNLVISCTNNFVTITATGADTLEYNMNGGTSFYITYTEPFHITESGTVNARATNADGSITASQAVTYIDYRPTINITEANNYVTVTASGANTILYRLGTISEYVAYTGPVYIAENTTIYVQATRTVAGVDYTSTVSQAVTHELVPPTNLVISCASNTVTITADNATTIEYNFDGSSTYTTYTEPFAITQTVTVYAKASNADGSITASQECEYQSVPFAENLVFYAPLTEGDLTDHISGKSPSTDSGCCVTWNSTYNMYELYCSSGNYMAALRWVGLSLYDAGHNISTDGLTVTARMKFVSQSGNNYSAFYSCDSLKDTFGQYKNNMAYLYNCNARYDTSGLGSDINRLTTTLTRSGSGNLKFYKNSTLAKSMDWAAGNISATRAPDTLSLCEMHTNNTNMTILISDVRVYNRVLSASEVAQL